MFGFLKKLFRPASADFVSPKPVEFRADFVSPKPVEFRWEERVESRPVEPAPVPAAETVTSVVQKTEITPTVSVSTEVKTEAPVETPTVEPKKAKRPKATKTAKPKGKKK